MSPLESKKGLNGHLTNLFILCSMMAQSPQSMSYQAIVRDAMNELVVNSTVGMQISILQDSITGTAVYVEKQTPVTNVNGLVSMEIGNGFVISGDFSAIDWSNGPYFIETATDPTGGNTYTIIGSNQLLSVPYALYAEKAGSMGPCNLSIGDSTAGGIIFYLDPSGCHGLISASSDQSTSTGAAWSNGTFVDTRAYGSGAFQGAYNTQMIILAQGTGTTSAASLCDNYSGGGFDDWYLPSIHELNLMYLNIGPGNSLGLGNVGGFDSIATYWSSTESGQGTAVWADWVNEHVFVGNTGAAKAMLSSVRAIRAF